MCDAMDELISYITIFIKEAKCLIIFIIIEIM